MTATTLGTGGESEVTLPKVVNVIFERPGGGKFLERHRIIEERSTSLLVESADGELQVFPRHCCKTCAPHEVIDFLREHVEAMERDIEQFESEQGWDH